MTIASIIGLILGGVASIVLMVLACVCIVPKKRGKKLKNKFLIFLHNLFNFKEFYIEKILKYIYLWFTIATICTSVFMFFFSWQKYTFKSGLYEFTEWTGYWWLIVLVAGPIVLRILYELSMMILVAVRNLVEINEKIKQPSEEEEEVPTAEPQQEQTKVIVCCTNCRGRMQVDLRFVGARVRCPHCQEIVVASPTTE